MHSKKQHFAHYYRSQTASKDPRLQVRLLKFDIYETWSLKANYILFLLIYVFHLRYIFSWSRGSDLFFFGYIWFLHPLSFGLAHHVVFVNLLILFFFNTFTCLILTIWHAWYWQVYMWWFLLCIYLLHVAQKFGICGQI